LKGTVGRRAGDVLGRLLPAFEGTQPPTWLLQRVAAGQAHGVTVFLRANARDAASLSALAWQLHGAAADDLPLLIAADQEGGQLVGLGHGTTRFPGAMALGAADDERLTEAVARATADELRALGVTVCYAPVCDLALEPRNVSLGTRAFGSDPEHVGRHAAATVRGLQAGGVAATLKHFPGFGAVQVDPHHDLPTVETSAELLETRELAPFRRCIGAGAQMVMSGHVALPAITADDVLPATLSRRVMDGLLREGLGFQGVSITDAMDMKAVAQGSAGIVDSILALRAGLDLLLLTPDRAAQRRLEAGLLQAELRGLLPAAGTRAALRRIGRLRRWLAGFEPPDPSVVRSAAHDDLALRAAAAAVTLVRDDARLLPLRPAPGDRIVVITPQPRDLTPADSSVDEPLALADAVRRHHPDVLEVRVGSDPGDTEIGAARTAAASASLAIVATLAADAQPGQARLVEAVLSSGSPTVTLAMRTPYDLAAYPVAATHVCSYSIVPASVRAVVDAMFGRAPITGRLPVAIPGRYPRGHAREVLG
jgi:beta-N-acetylhexosaminidase